MARVSRPGNELARLKALRDLAVLDTRAEESFDELTRTAALVCGVPIALISLIDAERQWFKSKSGLDASETPRELAFCAHAILRPDELLEVPDALMDARFADNPLVTGEPGIRFYSGAPLVDEAGHALGTLCVIDRRPRQLEPWQREVLGHLARQVVRLFAARALANRLVALQQPAPATGGVADLATGAVLVHPDGRLEANDQACAMVGQGAAQLPDLDAWFARVHGDAHGEERAAYDRDRLAGFPTLRVVAVATAGGRQRRIQFQHLPSPTGELWLLRDVTTVAAAEERFRVLFEHSSDAHLLFDDSGIIDCNHAAIAMLRCRDKNQLLSQHPARLSPEFQPDGRRSDEKCIEMDRLARDRGHHRFEWQHRRLDGSDFPVEVTLTPVQLAGHPVLLAVWHDLSERHAAEERLRDSIRRFDLVAAGAAIGIWETRFDPAAWRTQLDGDLPFYWSRRFVEIMGYSPAEFPDRLAPWLDALHPEDRERTMAAVVDCLANGVPYNVEYRLRHRNGTYRWYHATGEAERDAQGRPHRMAGSMADINARKRDEELLEIARAQLIDAIGNIDAGFAMFAADGRLVVSNPQFQSLFALAPGDVAPGTPYHAILAAKCAGGALQGVGMSPEAWMAERLAAHRDPGAAREYRLAGRWIRIADRRTADGGLVSLHTDVTALRDAAEEMRRARDLAEGAGRAKADFLATMSHELRTPMNGVIGMTSLLLDTPLGEQQREFAETVRLCGDQLLALINDILDFSKIEAGSLVLEHIPFSPRRLAEDCVALLADQAERKGLQLICLIDADVPGRLLGDPTRLRQVVLNLLGNAVKFTERGEVVLALSAGAASAGRASLSIAVRDTGIGIPARARERLFKPFSQADSSTTRKYGGTGLGLVICERLVQLMEGAIELESQVGKGTTFTCRMPLALAADTPAEQHHAGLVGRRVLVVGPSAAARRSLREQFIGWGMLCDEAATAEAALAAAALARPALVVLDHDQAADGMVLAERLGQEASLAGVPLVLLVAAGHRGLASAARQAGIAGLLTRPVRHQQLFDCLLVVFAQAGQGERRDAAAPELVTRHSLEEQREPRRVLVVEDNAVNRQVAVMMLAKLGCRCDVAGNGQEAVEAVARQDYQLVFMDCQMPVMDGFAATNAIRKREGDQRRTRIVALTANAMPGDRERCLAAGMDDYLTKPIAAGDFAAALQRTDQRKAMPSSQAATGVAPAAILDGAALQALVDATDGETLRAVAGMLRDEAGTALAELRAALAGADAVGMGRVAHRLKGSTGTLGLRRVQGLCQELEQRGRGRRLEGAEALLAALEQALAEALPALAAHPLVAGG